MVDIDALLRALPISGLEPAPIAFIAGLTHLPPALWWRESITLVEPPAGAQHVPFVDPLQTVEQLLRYLGEPEAGVAEKAWGLVMPWLPEVPKRDRVRFYNYIDCDAPEHIPAPALLRFLAGRTIVPADVLGFLEDAVKATAHAVRFGGPDNPDASWGLDELPDLPPPKAMIEFVPGPPWDEYCEYGSPTSQLFTAWRDRIRPVAACIEQETGQSPYYFSNLDDELDDDSVHRFLVLHWCCTHAPQSPYVEYLVKVSRAPGVEDLRRALESTESYRYPFEMNDAFIGMEAGACRFQYGAPDLIAGVPEG